MWPKRRYYRDLLVSKVKAITAATPVLDLNTYMAAQLLLQSYIIGSHVKKAPTLLETVKSLPSGTPYQIFLGGNQNTRLTVKDADIAAAAEYVDANNIIVYIHSPYLINLSASSADNWQQNYIQRLLQYSATLGAKGVVVHTGKHTKDTYEEGVEKMRKAIEEIIPYATPACPLLLETPSGQGTELLLGQEEFLDFVESFESPNISCTLDTCHMFACGHDPLKFIKDGIKRNIVNLVHFNDSQEQCGCKKDRHAQPGLGKIGPDTMTQIAELCSANRIHMLVE
jgi:deoxyribonuclease-4